jgi:hypothetical protein
LLAAGLGGCNRDAPQAPEPASGPPNGAETLPTPERSRPWFSEEAGARGLDFVHDSGHREDYFIPESLSGGAALMDIDSDGDLDAYFVQAGELEAAPDARSPNRLFRNDGAGHFTDITEGSGTDDRGYGMGVAGGDYDNDGDIDIYVTNLGRNTLLRNEGNGTFADVTETAGVGDTGFGAGATFADFNGDGQLDLFVTNYIHWSSATDAGCLSPTGGPDYCSPNHFRAPATDVLYLNDGDGSFQNVTAPAGLTAGFGNGLGVLAADFNDDFLVDFFVANDGMPDQLWQNNGDGTFTDIALVAGCAVDLGGSSKAGMGIDARDLDDDGDLDLLVGNLTGETDSLFYNEGGYFIDRTISAGLAAESQRYTRFGLGFVDFDQDGRLDLFEATGRVSKTAKLWTDDPFAEPNLLLRGIQENRFEPVQPPGGTAEILPAAGRAAAFGDVDGDLDIDILIVNRDGPAHLLINSAPTTGRAVLFRVLNEHGADAIGARVTMELGSRTVRRDVRTGYSYLACNDPRIHVGVGEARSVADVRVRWNDGTTEHFGDFDTGALHHLRRGSGRH